MKLAYIAGPFRAANAWQRAQNIREAEQVGMDVAEHLGVQPVIPHSNTGNFDGTLDDAFWLEGTKEMIRRCDMVVCTERWHASTGAKDEVKEAHRLNIPAYVKIGACYYPILNDGFPALRQRLDPWELKAIIEADWKREITIDPSTNSISATLAACSAPVPEIVRVHPTGAGDHGSIDVTTGDGLTRYAVQQVLGKSLRGVSVEELAKLGLKPSQPEPPPTGNGDLVTPSLTEALADYPELAALVSARDAFGRAKYGTGLRTNNGRDPIEDARQELGDLLQYVWQAKMEVRDIHPFLDLWSKAYSAIFPHDERDKRLCDNMLEYVQAVRDVTTGSKPAYRARAMELYADITRDMLESDPRKDTVERMREMMGPAPTLHPRPFFWDSNDLFCFVNCEMTPSVPMGFLLQCVPNALDGRESHHPLDPGDHPRFGFRLEHDGPRTLREYLEAS